MKPPKFNRPPGLAAKLINTARALRPPVYRPQNTPRVLQTKPAPASHRGNQPARPHPPSAPPVYRPQPVPKVLQTKRLPGPTPGAPNIRRPPVAAPARVQPGKIVQPKANARVVQFAEHPSQHYSGHWPPPNYPPQIPPTPSGQYYEEAADYHARHRDMDAFDDYIDQYGTFMGTSVGQTFGTQENEDYDASYVDIPGHLRPSAPNAKTLWNLVYAGLAPVPTNNNLLQVACAERNDAPVQVDSHSKKEAGTDRKPPMCHIIAFNHIRWAADWIKANPSHAWIKGFGTYKGPDPSQYPNDTWKEVVWHLSNLQPGHSKCNSMTAKNAVGQPATPLAQKAAVVYVAGRLKALESTWF